MKNPATLSHRASLVRTFLLSVFFLGLAGTGWGQTTVGPNEAGTGTNVATIGTVAWTNPGYIATVSTTDRAVVTPNAGNISNYLMGTGYGFTIPSNVQINGIEVVIGKLRESGSGNEIYDYSVRLVKNGSVTGSDYAQTSTNWTRDQGTPADVTYGGSSNLWGTTWTPSEINASNFGVAISATSPDNGVDAYVYYMRISITYTVYTPGETVTQTFSYTGSDQTYSVPNCVTSITAKVWGAGGGGGARSAQDWSDWGDRDGGGGGGGGGFRGATLSVQSGDELTISVGAGGAGNSDNDGSAGGESYIEHNGDNRKITAYGGGGGERIDSGNGGGDGGSGGSGTFTSEVTITNKIENNGGTGGNGDGSEGGGGGGGAGDLDGAYDGGNGGNPTAGEGGDNLGGNGGSGGDDGNGGNGSSYGGGGGGGGDSGQNGGSGANGGVIITYTLPNNPTITLGANPSVPQGSTSANLPYSATSGCPDQYSIDWDAAANTAGFIDFTDYASLPDPSPIVLTVPAGAAAATYNGTLTVKNSTYGFVSSGFNFTVTITATATTTMAPNTVASASICAGSTKVPIQSFTLAQTGSTVNLTGLTFSTAGTYLAADLTKFQLWTNTTNSLSGATQVGSDITTTLGPAGHSFGTISQALNVNTTLYFWITMDVATSPANGGTLSVPTLTTSHFTVSAGTKAGSSSAGGTLMIYANNTASAPSSTPSLCINTALSPDITHTTTGATGIGTPTGLPAGVTASWASNTITISGTPTASGPFIYSIPLTGGCGSVNATGTITVNAGTTTMGNNTVLASSMCASFAKVAAQSFTMAQTVCDDNLTGLSFTTTGNYSASDITKFQLWINSSNDLASASQVGSDLTTSLGTDSHSFAAFSQALTTGTTSYFWITMDVASSPANGAMLTVSALTTGDFTVSSGTKAGSCTTGGTQTMYALPTITTGGTLDAVCYSTSAQSTSMAYSATTNSPTSYAIDWDAAANTAGLSDQSYTSFTFLSGGGTLTGIPITAGATAGGPYSGIMTIVANGCTNTQTVSVTINALPTFTTSNYVNVSCYGGSDGSIQVNITGGVDNSTYTFSVNNGTDYNATYTGSFPTYTLTGLPTGTHKIRVKDGNGCESADCQ